MSKFASIVLAAIAVALSGCVEENAYESGVISDSYALRIINHDFQTKKDSWLVCLDGIGYIRYSNAITAKIDPATKLPESCTDSVSLNQQYLARVKAK